MSPRDFTRANLLKWGKTRKHLLFWTRKFQMPIRYPSGKIAHSRHLLYPFKNYHFEDGLVYKSNIVQDSKFD